MLKRLQSTSLFLFLCFSSYAVDNPGNDPIARYYQPAYLFNQDSVFANPDLRDTFRQMGFSDQDLSPLPDYHDHYHAISTEISPPPPDLRLLEKEIVSEFYKRRRILYSSAIFQEFVGAASLPVLLAVGAVAAYMAHTENGAYFMSLMIMNSLYTFVTSSYGMKNLVGSLLNPNNDCLLAYELAYAKKKFAVNFIDRAQKNNPENLLYPEQLFLVARRNPENLLKTIRFFDTLLRVPYQSCEPKVDWRSLKKSLLLYGQETQEMILASCINHLYAYQTKLGFNPAHKELLLFVSPPGCGKNTLVQAIGHHMSLNVASVCLAGCTVESLQGTEESPGLLLETLVQLSVRNGVLFLDELDKVMTDAQLLGILLPLIESGAKSFYSPYLRRSIDISHLLIIAAVNEDFSAQHLISLKDRFPKIADLTIVNKKEMSRVLKEVYLPSKLTIEEQLKETFERELNSTLSSVVEDNKTPSFRTPQALLDQNIGTLRLRRHRIFEEQ